MCAATRTGPSRGLWPDTALFCRLPAARNVKLERTLAVARSSVWAVLADYPNIADWNDGLKKSYAIGDATEGVGGVSTGYCGWRRGGLLGGPHAAPMRNGQSWAAVA